MEIQKISEVKGLKENNGMIAAIRRDNPLKKDLYDKEVFLDIFKNQPVDQQLSIYCWKKLQSQLAKYSKYYPKYSGHCHSGI